MENNITDYEQRKLWRIKLNKKRILDKDQSADRYKKDASLLNRAMKIYDIKGRVANW